MSAMASQITGVSIVYSTVGSGADQKEDKKPTLVQVMAWCRQATSHYLSQCWLKSVSSYDVIKRQWIYPQQSANRMMKSRHGNICSVANPFWGSKDRYCGFLFHCPKRLFDMRQSFSGLGWSCDVTVMANGMSVCLDAPYLPSQISTLLTIVNLDPVGVRRQIKIHSYHHYFLGQTGWWDVEIPTHIDVTAI